MTIKNRSSSEAREEPAANRAQTWSRAGGGPASAGFAVGLALFLFSTLTGCTPAGPRALLEGKRRIEQGRYTQAIAQLRTATSLLPTNAQAWNYLGLAYHYAGQAGEAEKAYQQALALDRDLSEAHYNLGCLLLEQNKTNSAKNELTAFTLRRANSSDGFLKLGLAQLRARDASGAEKSFKDALRLNPHLVPAVNGLGLARAQKGRWAEAAQFFNAALKLQSDYPSARLNLAIVNQQYLKDRPAAMRAYQAYLASKPPPANADAIQQIIRHLEQELAHLSHPQVTNTLVLATPAKVPLTEPAHATAAPAPKPEPVPEPKIASAPVLPASNDFEIVRLRAEPAIKPAQDVPPPPQDTFAEPAQSAATNSHADPKLAKRGLLERMNPLNLFRNQPKPAPEAKASETVASSLARNIPDPPESGSIARYSYKSPAKPAAGNREKAEPWFQKGVQAQKAERLPEALENYRRALGQDPSYAEAYYNMGLIHSDAGESVAGLEAYELALACRPAYDDARYNFALLLIKSEFFTDAESQLNRLLQAHPQDARSHLALGNLYAQQLHEPAKAREHYLKVLEAAPQHPQAGAIRFWLSSNP